MAAKHKVPKLTARVLREALETGRLVFLDHKELAELFEEDWRPDGFGGDAFGFVKCDRPGFAQMNGVRREQVSRWVKKGLPKTPDNRIPYTAGCFWVDSYHRRVKAKMLLPPRDRPFEP